MSIESIKQIYQDNFDVAKKAQGVLARLKAPTSENVTKAINAVERGAKLAEAYEGDEFWLEDRWTYLMCISSDMAHTLVGDLFRMDALKDEPKLEAEYRKLTSKEDVIKIRDEFKEKEKAKNDELKKLNDEMNDRYKEFEGFVAVTRGYAESIEEAQEKIDEQEQKVAAAQQQG